MADASHDENQSQTRQPRRCWRHAFRDEEKIKVLPVANHAAFIAVISFQQAVRTIREWLLRFSC